MIDFLPDILPDETLSSHCGRWYEQSGHSTYAHFQSCAYGRVLDWKILDVGGAPALEWVHGHVLSPEYAARRHTLEPFMAYFIARGTKAHIELHDRRTGSLKHLADGRRYCPSCCTEQLNDSGFTAWVRRHNLPGVTVCAKHMIRLVEVVDRTPTIRPPICVQPHDDLRRASSTEGWYASQCQRLLDLPDMDVDAQRLRQALFAALSLHYPSDDGQTFDTSRVRDAIYQFFAGSVLFQFGFTSSDPRADVLYGVRASDRMLNPASVMVLMRVAGITNVAHLVMLAATSDAHATIRQVANAIRKANPNTMPSELVQRWIRKAMDCSPVPWREKNSRPSRKRRGAVQATRSPRDLRILTPSKNGKRRS